MPADAEYPEGLVVRTERHKVLVFKEGVVNNMERVGFGKGSRVLIEGKLVTTRFDRPDGEKVTSTRVYAEDAIMMQKRSPGARDD